jgi:hypothetical protein
MQLLQPLQGWARHADIDTKRQSKAQVGFRATYGQLGAVSSMWDMYATAVKVTPVLDLFANKVSNLTARR